jgi:hypothetical protein
MHPRLPKTVLAEIRRHGHLEPMLSCDRCRAALIEHAHRRVVIPTLKRLAVKKRKRFDEIMTALSNVPLQ